MGRRVGYSANAPATNKVKVEYFEKIKSETWGGGGN